MPTNQNNSSTRFLLERCDRIHGSIERDLISAHPTRGVRRRQRWIFQHTTTVRGACTSFWGLLYVSVSRTIVSVGVSGVSASGPPAEQITRRP